VAFRSPNEHNPGGVRFLFNVEPLSDGETDTIVVQAEEIAEWRLVPASQAPALFADSASASAFKAVLLGGPSVLYMEDEQLVS
jgi:hypothetical protein